jgi:hypothetical protein
MFISSIFNDIIQAFPRCKAKREEIYNYIEKNLVQNNWRLEKIEDHSLKIVKYSNNKLFDSIIISIPPEMPGNRIGQSICSMEVYLNKNNSRVYCEKLKYTPKRYFNYLSDLLTEILYLINYSG